jgi:hypothetical protein
VAVMISNREMGMNSNIVPSSSFSYIIIHNVYCPVIAVTEQRPNLFRWHVDHQEDFPMLHQIALDILSIPAISTECERVFSSAKKLINPMRCSLKEDIIEATMRPSILL